MVLRPSILISLYNKKHKKEVKEHETFNHKIILNRTKIEIDIVNILSKYLFLTSDHKNPTENY